jgi:AcrR family transcriptional regulator
MAERTVKRQQRVKPSHGSDYRSPIASVRPESDDRPATARQRRAERGRRELAEAAVRLIDEHGFGNVTVDEIADAADYSASTFFRYFKTKEDAVFFDVSDRLEYYRSLLDHAGDDRAAWTRIREVLLENADYWQDGNSKFAVTRTKLFHREPPLFKRYLDICAQYEAVIASIFADERDADPEEDVFSGVVAGAIIAAWRTAFRVWILRGGSLRGHLGIGLEMIEAGISPEH